MHPGTTTSNHVHAWPSFQVSRLFLLQKFPSWSPALFSFLFFSGVFPSGIQCLSPIQYPFLPYYHNPNFVWSSSVFIRREIPQKANLQSSLAARGRHLICCDQWDKSYGVLLISRKTSPSNRRISPFPYYPLPSTWRMVLMSGEEQPSHYHKDENYVLHVVKWKAWRAWVLHGFIEQLHKVWAV